MCRWGELPQLGSITADDGIAVAIEPRAGIEIVAAGPDLDERRPMGMPQHQQVDIGVLGQLLLRPRALLSRGGVDRWALKTMLAQPGGEPVDQGKPELRVQVSIDR